MAGALEGQYGAGRPKRILFATVDSSWAGAQAQMLELAAGLDRAQFEPVLLTTGRGELVTRSRSLGIRTHVVPYRFMRRVFPFVGYYLLGPLVLRRILRRERISLVHTHDPNSAAPIMRAAWGIHLPLVSHIHDFDQRWLTSRTLPVLQKSNAVIVAISDACARYAVQRGANPQWVRRVYNGVHLPPLSPDERARARAALGLEEEEIAIALVGRLVRRKGQEELLRALAQPRLARLPLRVFLIGRGEHSEPRYEAHLRQVAASHGLTSRVAFLEQREDVQQLLAGIDICVLAARREAFGRVVVEGMHAGAALVVANDGGLPELVRDGCEGLIVPPGDVDALAAAIDRLSKDAVLRAQLGAAGRRRAAAFSHEQFIANMSTIYRDLLRSGAPTTSRER